MKFYRQITISSSLWRTKLGAPSWAKKSIPYSFGVDKYFDRIRYLSISVPNVRDMDTIYRYIVSCEIG